MMQVGLLTKQKELMYHIMRTLRNSFSVFWTIRRIARSQWILSNWT